MHQFQIFKLQHRYFVPTTYNVKLFIFFLKFLTFTFLIFIQLFLKFNHLKNTNIGGAFAVSINFPNVWK